MDLRPQPETDHDYLISLWTFLVGTNGDGLLGKFEKFQEKTDTRLTSIETQLPMCWTREDHIEAEKTYAQAGTKRLERRKVSAQTWWLIAMTIVGPIVAVIIAEAIK